MPLILTPPKTQPSHAHPWTQALALPQLPLFVLLFLDLGIQDGDPLLALLQHGLLPGKR